MARFCEIWRLDFKDNWQQVSAVPWQQYWWCQIYSKHLQQQSVLYKRVMILPLAVFQKHTNSDHFLSTLFKNICFQIQTYPCSSHFKERNITVVKQLQLALFETELHNTTICRISWMVTTTLFTDVLLVQTFQKLNIVNYLN